MSGRGRGGEHPTFRARLTVAGHSIDFVTECAGAFEYVTSIDHLMGIRPYGVTRLRPGDGTPTLHYRNEDAYRAEFDVETRTMHFAFPWKDDVPDLFDQGGPFHHLLLYPVRLLLELLRQESSEYTIHASAVAKDGRAILISGEAESGKTTTALHLCRSHGFSIVANDQSVVALRGRSLWLVHGDPTINLRQSSTEEYSRALAARVFGSGPTTDAWEVDRELPAEDLGVQATDRPAALALLVRIRLDRTADQCAVRVLSPAWGDRHEHAAREDEFFAKLELYREITAAIRGASFTPLHEDDLALVDLFSPDLDQPTLLEQRVRFMNTLFDGGQVGVVSVRGPLEACGWKLLELFEEGRDRVSASRLPSASRAV